MAGFMPAIHDFLFTTADRHKSWVAGTRPAMTVEKVARNGRRAVARGPQKPTPDPVMADLVVPLFNDLAKPCGYRSESPLYVSNGPL
jgi:hypothetical protein